MLTSGGHCQILIVEGVGKYKQLGATIDDAAGEAFDKTAKIMGLGYPGGPKIEQSAKNGDKNRFKFPKPLAKEDNCDFSWALWCRRIVSHGPERPKLVAGNEKAFP